MMTGTLYIVATPIGHLQDISYRMLTVLREADFIAAEDTRVSQKIKKLAGSRAQLISHHKFNESKNEPGILRHLKEGKNVALITDAGTPCICDPGYRLVQASYSAGITVTPIPGPSSVTAACSVSGFACSRFVFLGYLPRKPKEIRELFSQFGDVSGPFVFYESPQRLENSIEILRDLFSSETELCLCKEITKKFETLFRGPIAEVLLKLKTTHPIRGEWTGVLEKKTDSLMEKSFQPKSLEEISRFFSIPRSKASKILSLLSGQSRQEIYKNAT
ncbi:MAG: 16S rRNA (cytidine(1402)-2'-O)-methyltransferase [Candidatus Aureabacteria bacterium]|nr:16S rRNA (cytidine(1402)-2'-O)-methyltransferase [Candidatus Auribacterota bacterium]